MRALVYDGQLKLQRDLAVPRDERAGALLRILKAGVCNTDLELVKGYLAFSGTLGHEFVGMVEEGASALIGKRVAGEINVACGKCDLCLKGIPSQCRSRYTVGIFRYPGAFADYLPLPERNLHLVPDAVS